MRIMATHYPCQQKIISITNNDGYNIVCLVHYCTEKNVGNGNEHESRDPERGHGEDNKEAITLIKRCWQEGRKWAEGTTC